MAVALPRIIPCFHSTGTCLTEFALNLAQAFRYSGTLVPLALHYPSCYVDEARNKLVEQFLATPEATHMLMIDVDMSFPADAFLQTYLAQVLTQADVVYGNYTLGNCGNSLFGPPEEGQNEPTVLVGLKPGNVYHGLATGGTGWLLATREILERMQAQCKGPWHWFDRDPTTDGKGRMGEDITFGLRALSVGAKIVGTTTVLLRHLKIFPLMPNFMEMPSTSQVVTFPNPYEDPEKFVVIGNRAVPKEAHAAQSGESTEEASRVEGTEGGAEESLHLRGPEENRVEASEGTGEV